MTVLILLYRLSQWQYVVALEHSRDTTSFPRAIRLEMGKDKTTSITIKWVSRLRSKPLKNKLFLFIARLHHQRTVDKTLDPRPLKTLRSKGISSKCQGRLQRTLPRRCHLHSQYLVKGAIKHPRLNAASTNWE